MTPFNLQNGPFDESKLKTAYGGEQDSGAVENVRDEKTKFETGETGGRVHVHVSDLVEYLSKNVNYRPLFKIDNIDNGWS